MLILGRAGMVIAVMLLTACGGGGAESKTGGSGSSPVETAGCRSAMSTLGSITEDLQTRQIHGARQYFQIFDRMQALQRRADRMCSATVTADLDRGMEKFMDARAQYTGCQFGLCNTPKIARDVVSGGQLVQKALTASERTKS